MGQVERVTQKCPQCQQVKDGFLIPDGRFVCPSCFPPPVYERWRREWEPIEKQRLKELAANEKAEQKRQRKEAELKAAEQERRFNEKVAELKAKAMEQERKIAEKNKHIGEQQGNKKLWIVHPNIFFIGFGVFLLVLVVGIIIIVNAKQKAADERTKAEANLGAEKIRRLEAENAAQIAKAERLKAEALVAAEKERQAEMQRQQENERRAEEARVAAEKERQAEMQRQQEKERRTEEARVAAATNAFKALKKFQARLEIGIERDEYRKALGEVWGEVKLFADSSDGQRLKELAVLMTSACQNYQDATSEWDLEVDAHAGMNRYKEYITAEGGKELYRKYQNAWLSGAATREKLWKDAAKNIMTAGKYIQELTSAPRKGIGSKD